MTERQGTQIDYCPQCRGVWLEKGKLDKIIERSGADLLPKTIPQAYGASLSGEMKATMINIRMIITAGIEKKARISS